LNSTRKNLSKFERGRKLKKRKIVYVAGAYSAPTVIGVFGNMRRGLALATQVLQAGFSPFAPWNDMFFSLLDEVSLETYYEYSMAFLEKSDAVVVVRQGMEQSKGTQAEIVRAHELGIPVYYNLEDLVESE
jgi:nucleoside 2-deoxyribosyltransferase